MAIAGIDYSLRGPSICVFHDMDSYTGKKTEEFSFRNCSFFFSNRC